MLDFSTLMFRAPETEDTPVLDFSTLMFRAPALLIALTIHEYAHACVSDSLGDPTPGLQGRLTLNPLAHLDIVGTLMLVLCGFGWAKPVEIDPRYYKDYRSGQLKVSAAGPLAYDGPGQSGHVQQHGEPVPVLAHAVQCLVRVLQPDPDSATGRFQDSGNLYGLRDGV